MADMRRPLYLHKKITRHGKVAWYFWPGHGSRIRIRGEYGSPEFLDAYKAAMAGGVEPQKRAKEAPETLAWLIARYRDSGVWAALSPATKRQRENIFKHVIDRSGDFPYSDIDRAAIVAGRDKRGPAAAKNFVAALRGLFKWAVDASLLQDDPTAGVQVARPKTDGFHVWSEDEISVFESHWPVGTRERLAFAIFLYTGLRRGDAARLGRQHIRNGLIDIRTEKNGTQILIPVLPVLKETIEASPTGDLAFIATKDGRPMTKESLGNWFREAAKAAGVPGNCHGIRKSGAVRASENGATEYQLNALFGWKDGSKESAVYTRTASRKRLAEESIEKLMKRNENKS